MPGPSLRVLSDSLFRPLSPNHQSRSDLGLGFVGPSGSLIDRGRKWPGIRPHKTITKSGKLVNCDERWGVSQHKLPEGMTV